ncbi:unnamed protein product [Symbiodinium natans]|uniref:Uncharacterized protein n=1 Tax=Symbiodinium natans TaxID=878477 RepID=A0A812UHQ7_9DINO|nr:unnamed protein product [Symbiodinium natans]
MSAASYTFVDDILRLRVRSVVPEEELTVAAIEKSVISTLVCPQEISCDEEGDIQLDDALRPHFMLLRRLELKLGSNAQSLRLTSPKQEEAQLPTVRSEFIVPTDARVLGFRYWEEAGSSVPRVLCTCRMSGWLGPCSLADCSQPPCASEYSGIC